LEPELVAELLELVAELLEIILVEGVVYYYDFGFLRVVTGYYRPVVPCHLLRVAGFGASWGLW
jgi:hypothetical protein